jgi:hypothetical protein
MSRWIDYPSPPLVHSRAHPLLVESHRLEQLEAHFRGATRADVEVAGAVDTSRVIEAMKAVLEFPDWCGSSWDSVDDVYEELHEAWKFPLLMVFRGFDQLLREHQHLALETTIQIDDLRRAFSKDGDQLIPVFEGAAWT